MVEGFEGVFCVPVVSEGLEVSAALSPGGTGDAEPEEEQGVGKLEGLPIEVKEKR